MVNTGTPSKGCYMCRARRIKCDEGRPNCNRCIKSKRVCPGYRDAFELKLRDENKSTKRKQQETRRGSEPSLGAEDAFPSTYAFNGHSYDHALFPNSAYGHILPIHSRSNSTGDITSFNISREKAAAIAQHRNLHQHLSKQLTTPLQQQAACYFLSNFVLVPESGTVRGYLDFVLPLLRTSDPSPSLSLAFSAVAFAALGVRPNSKSLLSQAGMWYLRALKEINAALRNPATASSDATLASVMLMSVFEQITPSRMKVGGWTSHVEGAVAVIKSRGIDQWKDKVSREIFVAVRAHMTIHCIANSKRADPTIDWLAVQSDDPLVESFASMNLKLAALRADNEITTRLREWTTENGEKVLGLLRRAKALDQEYAEWIAALPANWKFTSVAWIEDGAVDLTTSIVYPGRVDAYDQLWIAYKYNIVRACRLNAWAVILRCVAWLEGPRDYRLSPEYVTATRICRQLVEDVVASVPYFFGWNRDRDLAMADRSYFACGTNSFVGIKPVAGTFAMWPLYAAATTDFASPSQQLFLKSRLRYIAKDMGINQAWLLLQAEFRTPSMYIARERFSQPQSNLTHGTTLEAKIERIQSESPPPSLPPLDLPNTPVSPPSQQTWPLRGVPEARGLHDDGAGRTLAHEFAFVHQGMRTPTYEEG